jgi:hypothetical protein
MGFFKLNLKNTAATGDKMTQPCIQGERLVTLEIILEQMAATLTEQKQLGVKTYEVLASISLQGEQISSLIADTTALKRDMEEAFKSLRRINSRHDREDGADTADTKWKKAGVWFFEKLSIPVLMTLCFLLWVGDKFNWFTRAAAIWKEFKG